MNRKRIVVLGAGIGGLVTANELRRLLPEHSITVVDKSLRHAFAPSFLWLMTGDRAPNQITRNVPDIARTGIEFVEAEVRNIDLENQQVQTGAASLNYDYLVIALGAELAWDTIPGLASAHTFYTLEGAAALRDTLRSFGGGKVAVVVGATPYKCPGAPHEGAMLLADFFRKHGLREKVEIHLFTPEPQPMPVAGSELGESVRKMLESQNIHFHPLHKLLRFEESSGQLLFEGKDSFSCDLLIAIPPHRAPAVAREAGLTNEAGWIPVDRATLSTKHKHIYAIGDITAISIPGRWKPDVPLMLPKAGVFAHGQALVVAHRIAAEVTGAESKDTFCGEGYCMLEAGETLAGFAFGNFFAEPSPNVQLRRMGKAWHWGKVLFEQWWLAPFGFRRNALGLAIKVGARAYGVPLVL
jgi:sulfide:quinone oxidoreductase